MNRLLPRIAVAAMLLALVTPSLAITDNFPNGRDGRGYVVDYPLENGANVTPSDSADLTNVSRACVVGGAGNVRVTTLGGQTLTITGVVAGQLLPMRFSRVLSTGTTATNITCWW
jgi:hypothetical protein